MPGVVILLVIAGIIVAGIRLQDVLQASSPPASILFDHGLSSVKIEAPSTWSNRQCGSCHQQEYQQWQVSRHAAAATNKKFQAQCTQSIGGRRQWCINCHAPTTPDGDRLPTQEPRNLDGLFSEQPPWLVAGVDCLACHVRNGKILTTHVSTKGQQAHPLQLAPELGTAEFCAGCHQFAFKSTTFGDEFHGQLQQASLEEFLDFRRSGGVEESCLDCHMPGGNHLMPGGYSNTMLQQALDLELRADWQPDPTGLLVTVSVTADHVGHRVPGGEHFRYLTLSTDVADRGGSLPELVEATEPTAAPGPRPKVLRLTGLPQTETMRRDLGLLERGLDPTEAPQADTRLRPGEKRTYRYFVPIVVNDASSSFRVTAELKYHKMNDRDAERFGFTPAEVVHTVLRAEESVQPGTDR